MSPIDSFTSYEEHKFYWSVHNMYVYLLELRNTTRFTRHALSATCPYPKKT